MIRAITTTIFASFFLHGCFSIDTAKENIKKSNDISINYYSEKTVTPLDIPPKFTQPDYQNAFRLSEYVKDAPQNIISFSELDQKNDDKETILLSDSDISVIKNGNIRYLNINKSPEIVWNLAKEFLILQGFVIDKSNKKIGIMETNFLENRPELPKESVGFIRSMFQKALAARYTLPTVDKFRIRIEPEDNYNKSRVYLSHSAMREVYKDGGTDYESTVWQNKDKDFELETEMLYRFMVYLSGEKANSREKILNAKEKNNFKVEIKEHLNGYKKMVFHHSFIESWDAFNWALDQMNYEIEDKDIVEKTIHIRGVEREKEGIMTAIFGNEAVKETYRFLFKSKGVSLTEVYFVGLTEEDSNSKRDFAKLFFDSMMKLFN